MRKALILVLSVGLVTVASSMASAGIVTDLLAFQNVNNDTVQDKSVGYVLDLADDNAPGVGDLGWGVIRVDKINNQNVNDRAFLVYSALLTTPLTPVVHTWVPQGAGNWSLQDLLTGVGNASSISNGAIAVLIETPNPVDFFALNGIDFNQGINPNAPSALRTAIQANFAAGSVLASFGLQANNPDYYWLTGNPVGMLGQQLTQQSEMSVIDSFVGPVTNWGPLFDTNAFDGMNWTDNEVAIDQGSLTIVGVDPLTTYFNTKDSAVYLVNYVPEPTSLMALLGLGLAGLAMSVVRRRRKS